MTDNQQAENAESALNNPPSNEPGNVGYDSFVIARASSKSPPEETPVEEPAEAAEAEPEEPAAPEETGESTEEEGIVDDEVSLDAETVLSQFDKLSPEEAKELAKAIGSRGAKRYAELTARRKQAEQEAMKLRQQLEQAQDGNPFEKPAKVENNPFEDLNDFDSLQAKAQELSQIDEWADNLLWEHTNADPGDVIVEMDGKELTKKEVREYQLNARKGIKTFLPARLSDIQQQTLAKQQEAAITAQAAKDISWLSDEETETYKAYAKTLEDPVIKEVREKVPSIAPQLNAIIAHAINSMQKAVTPEKKAPAKPPGKISTKPAPPSNPQGNAGARFATSGEVMSKQLNELSKRYQESGDLRDYQALRAAQIANRQ